MSDADRAPRLVRLGLPRLGRGDRWARWRITLTYLWRHRRLPRIDRPRRLTEWVQHRKLFDRDRRMPQLADKVGVKAIVADRLGAAWVTPTLWSGDTLPAEPPWPLPFVVKARHGCGHVAFVREPRDWEIARQKAARWITRRYGWWLDEWLYGLIPRGLLVEPFIGESGVLPLDFKLLVFGGRVEFIEVHVDREHRHRWTLVDRDWRAAAGCNADWLPTRPANLNAMIAAAEVLGCGFDCVRIDLYEVAGRPRFGEMTFYPGSGLHAIDPPALDTIMGGLWQAAAQSSIR